MERDRVERYVRSLEKTLQNDHQYLKETTGDFQRICLMVTPERSVPAQIIIDIRETYKEIRTRLTEIKAIQQLLQGKYRQYYRRDSVRDKEIMEFGFIAKNCHSKFEYVLMQKQAQEKAKAKEPERAFKGEKKEVPFQWFRSKENQVMFIRNLRILVELDYESTPQGVAEERRDLAGKRSLTFFLFNGDPLFLDDLQSKIRLREHDIIERYGADELRGVLAHLREVNPLEVEGMIRRFIESKGFSKLKCLLLPIHSQKDLEGDVLGLIKAALKEMYEGEVKTLSI